MEDVGTQKGTTFVFVILVTNQTQQESFAQVLCAKHILTHYFKIFSFVEKLELRIN